MYGETTMNLKRVLVPATEDDPDIAGLSSAFNIADRFHAHVDVLFVRPSPEDASLYLGMDPGPHEDLQEWYRHHVEGEGKRAASRARRRFNRACKKHGIARTRRTTTHDMPSTRFTIAKGEAWQQVAKAAKLSDLTIFAGSRVRSDGLLPSLLECVLVASGSPVLFCPTEQHAHPFLRTAIAWDGSVQAARAIRDATPLLQEAEAVQVVSVEGGREKQSDPRGVAEYLALHGVTAEPRVVRCDREEAGQALLAEANNFDAQLLVMGGYAHSRVREVILGGTTRYVLQHSTTPVLLIH